MKQGSVSPCSLQGIAVHTLACLELGEDLDEVVCDQVAIWDPEVSSVLSEGMQNARGTGG